MVNAWNDFNKASKIDEGVNKKDLDTALSKAIGSLSEELKDVVLTQQGELERFITQKIKASDKGRPVSCGLTSVLEVLMCQKSPLYLQERIALNEEVEYFDEKRKEL